MKGLTRRETLFLGLGSGLAACGGDKVATGGALTGQPVATPVPAPTSTPTPTAIGNGQGVRVAAAAKNMRFGSTFAWSAAGADAGTFANRSYATLLERDCQILVPENELNWAAIRLNATTFDFAHADDMLAYAEAHRMAMRGHNLLWYDGRFDPAWLSTYDFGAAHVGPKPRAHARSDGAAALK